MKHTRKSIVKSTLSMGMATGLSRVLGWLRDILMIRFLGVGALSDAFNTAFMLPNTLRKIFAEGALTAALSPTLVDVMRRGTFADANRLITFVFAITETALLIVCFFLSFNSDLVVHCIAPGFSPENLVLTSKLATILIYFIIFISGAAVFSSALAAAHRFFIPAIGQVILNLLLIVELLVCLHARLSVVTLASLMLANGALFLLLHWYAYKQAGFSCAWPTAETKTEFLHVLKKFLPCVITVGSMEISLVIDRMMASYLPTGSISLLYYSSQFMRVPLGMFAIGFAAILLPHMTHVAHYAPRRLWFYLLESIKFIAWVTIPASLLMIAFSHEIFSTFLLSERFTSNDVMIAARLLSVFACGLFFFSSNKVLTNIFYAYHDTVRPTIIALIGAVVNTGLNYIFMGIYGIVGIVLATTVSAALQTVLFLVILHRLHNVAIPLRRLGIFMINTSIQCAVFGLLLYCIVTGMYHGMEKLPGWWGVFFCKKIGFWLWVGPLCATLGLFMYMTRKKFGIRIYFLEQQG